MCRGTRCSLHFLLVTFFTRYTFYSLHFLLRQDAILHKRASCWIQFFVGYVVVLLCLAVVAVIAVDSGGVCAPTPQKFF